MACNELADHAQGPSSRSRARPGRASTYSRIVFAPYAHLGAIPSPPLDASHQRVIACGILVDIEMKSVYYGTCGKQEQFREMYMGVTWQWLPVEMEP